MAEWSNEFSDWLDTLANDTLVRDAHNGVAHAMMTSWAYEENVLVWLTKVPGLNTFGSTVLFVNDGVLQLLQWDFEDWVDGTAPAASFNSFDRNMLALHLAKKSSLPVRARIRKKNTPQNQEGLDYTFHFHYDLPYGTRLTVAYPSE